MLRTHHAHTLTALSLSSDKDTGQDSKVPHTATKYARRKLESQQRHSDSARRQAKGNWHPDRCGFFDRSVTGFSALVQERGLQRGGFVHVVTASQARTRVLLAISAPPRECYEYEISDNGLVPSYIPGAEDAHL